MEVKNCKPCQKAKEVTNNIIRVAKDNITNPIKQRLTQASAMIETTFFGGDIEVGIERAKICTKCPEFKDFNELEGFSDTSLTISYNSSRIIHSDSESVIEAVPEIENKFCGQCSCPITKKVLQKVTVRKENGKVINNEEIKEIGCPLNQWYFHPNSDNY